MVNLRRIRNGLFGAAIAGALGFGGAQLMATPSQTCVNIPCENEEARDRCCQALFPGPLTTGFCGPEGECLCAV
jgi:hypothetical protein